MHELRHMLDIADWSLPELQSLMDTADDIILRPGDYASAMARKKLASLFYEPSTRTRLSFEAAMLELGGSVLGFSEASSSSASKGESVSDTVRTVSCYADIIAMRHPKEGAPTVAARFASVPIVNAGDGGHNHPTQTLADLLTIRREKGRLDNLVVGLCGDLQFGRTVHSLLTAMSRYQGVQFVLISPDELRIPAYLREQMQRTGVPFTEVRKLEDVIQSLDILYMTRVQRERFFNEADYVRLKDSYILDRDKLALARGDLVVMHPLPRVNEISQAVDSDPAPATSSRCSTVNSCARRSSSSYWRRKHEHRRHSKRLCDRPYPLRQGDDHLPLPAAGQAGLLGRHHQKRQEPTHGSQGYH